MINFDKTDAYTQGGALTATGGGGLGFFLTQDHIYLLIAIGGFLISIWGAWSKYQEHKQRKGNEALEREILLQRQRDDADRMIMSKERHAALMAAIRSGDRRALDKTLPTDAAQRMNDILDEVGG